jgi:hypothetical protein
VSMRHSSLSLLWKLSNNMSRPVCWAKCSGGSWWRLLWNDGEVARSIGLSGLLVFSSSRDELGVRGDGSLWSRSGLNLSKSSQIFCGKILAINSAVRVSGTILSEVTWSGRLAVGTVVVPA